jgi:hypothetical protein
MRIRHTLWDPAAFPELRWSVYPAGEFWLGAQFRNGKGEHYGGFGDDHGRLSRSNLWGWANR